MTHISTASNPVTLGSTWNYSPTIIAAGGGGGSDDAQEDYTYGNGGGIQGNTSFPSGCIFNATGTTCTRIDASSPYYYTGATQTSGYARGYGESGRGSDSGGGGGGWYGGYSACNTKSGGGSGYIGSSNLISGGGITKHMTCYSCTTSNVAATRTQSNMTTPTSTPTADVARIGNGYARITYLGTTI